MVSDAQKALNCLAIELTEGVYKDVKAKIQPVIDDLTAARDLLLECEGAMTNDQLLRSCKLRAPQGEGE